MDAPPNLPRGEMLPRQAPQTVPPGVPRWVTAELLAETIRVWQPYYSEPLTAEDALAMILSVGQLFAGREPPKST